MTRFERAVRTGNPESRAGGRPRTAQPMLRDALRVVLMFAARAPERYPAAAARFGGRLISDSRLPVAEAQLAFAALQKPKGPGRGPGVEALCALLERHCEPRPPAAWTDGFSN